VEGATAVGSMVVGSMVVGSMGGSTAVEVGYLLAQASGTDILMGILMDTTGILTGTDGSPIGTTGIVKGVRHYSAVLMVRPLSPFWLLT
jgi:hypothetical protein